MDSKLNDSIPSLLCLCVSEIEDGDFSGRIVSRYREQPQEFNGSSAFFRTAQSLFDQIGYPQSNTRIRTFRAQGDRQPLPIAGVGLKPCRTAAEIWQQRGSLTTFVVGVTSRHNATWQGRAAWVEGNETLDFSSELDLVRWMTAITDRTAEAQ